MDNLLQPRDPDGVDPEALPPDPKILEFGSLRIPVTRKSRFFFSTAGLACLCAVGAFFLSEFNQVRGIVDLAYSRVMLGGLYLTGFFMCLLVSAQLWRKRWAIAFSIVVPLALVFLADWWAPKPSPNPKPSLEVVLIPPPHTAVTLLTWVPLSSIMPTVESYRKVDYPPFRLKNVSNDPVVSIELTWSIVGEPIANIISGSALLQKYGTAHAPGRFRMTGANGMGFSSQITDRDTTTHPYLAGLEEVEVAIPNSIWSSLILRLLDAQRRPPEGPGDAGSELSTYRGPTINMTVTYRQSTEIFARSFSIETTVIPVADDAFIGGAMSLPNRSIPIAFRSRDNLRAYLRFSALAASSGKGH